MIFLKCLIYSRWKLVSWSMNIHQESSSILKPMNLLLGLWLDFLGLVLLALNYRSPQTLNRFTIACSQPVLFKLQFLCYSWINSILLANCLKGWQNKRQSFYFTFIGPLLSSLSSASLGLFFLTTSLLLDSNFRPTITYKSKSFL